MTIAELRAVQTERGLCNVHVVELRDDGFTIAHTDQERMAKSVGYLLIDCELHQWLAELWYPPTDVGIYTAEFIRDAWELTPLAL